jgi:hypothetical protein
MKPFSIKIFVPSGDPEGVRIVSHDDWPGKAVVFTRELLGEVKGRREYQQPGVYMLVVHVFMCPISALFVTGLSLRQRWYTA